MPEHPALDDEVRKAYASVEPSIRVEFHNAMAGLARDAAVRPPADIESATNILKFISYNKAAIFAYCFAETRRDHPPKNPRGRSEANIFLTTCVDGQFAELRRYTGVRPYVMTFFPERVMACEQQARLQSREALLRPYDFLALDRPRLYDFAKFNRCLMASE
ncbi:MAG: hypothetical protein FJX62_24880 [Alphaproteobacteria bacterium]|nr:hypothetical protein [Alphaproteobacteria bacterium]